MTWQTGPDWLNAGEWTPYPFLEDSDLSRGVVDGQVVVGRPSVGRAIFLTDLNPVGPQLRLVDDQATELVQLTDVVGVSSFGDYQTWSVSGDGGSATLVIKTSAIQAYSDAQGLELVPNALSVQQDQTVVELQAETSPMVFEVAAGPGSGATLVEGSHLQLEARQTPQGLEIEIGAVYRPDGPCVPSSLTPAATAVRTINGVPPSELGDFMVRGDTCIQPRLGGIQGSTSVEVTDPCTGDTTVVSVGPYAPIELRNICRACCDCEDYERYFDLAKLTHERLEQLNKWQATNQKLYQKMLQLMKSLLDTEIVGTRYDQLKGD